VDGTLGEHVLLQLLDYVGNQDLNDVASWTLEVWGNLSSLMDTKSSPKAAGILQQILPRVASVMHRQCTCPLSLADEKLWARAVGGIQLKLMNGDIEDRLKELMEFRRDVLDTLETMVNRWPDVSASVRYD